MLQQSRNSVTFFITDEKIDGSLEGENSKKVSLLAQSSHIPGLPSPGSLPGLP
jgi:hypothetical protein